jgi:two-component system, NtrC family, response regulator AtoC
LLAREFVKQFSLGRKSFSASALEAITAYSWPGNIRELANAVESAVILSENTIIETSDLPERIQAICREDQSTDNESVEKAIQTLKDVERDAIAKALSYFAGHRSQTATALGIDRKTLYSKIKEYGL